MMFVLFGAPEAPLVSMMPTVGGSAFAASSDTPKGCAGTFNGCNTEGEQHIPGQTTFSYEESCKFCLGSGGNGEDTGWSIGGVTISGDGDFNACSWDFKLVAVNVCTGTVEAGLGPFKGSIDIDIEDEEEDESNYNDYSEM